MEEDIDRILPELSYRSTLLWSRLNLIGQTPFLKEIQPQDDTTVAVDEQTLALIINGEQEGLIWGQRSTSHSWCSRRGVSQSPTSQDPQWRCGCPWVSDAISQDRLPPPVWGTKELLTLQFMPLSLSLSQGNQSQWDFVGLSKLKACFIRVL